MSDMTKTLDLAHYTGTENYWGHWTHQVVYTDGVRAMAEQAEAYWLIDLIASYQRDPRITGNPRLGEMQFWRLDVRPNGSAVATCREDSDIEPAITQVIPMTDFPAEGIDIWVAHDGSFNKPVLYLKSEH